MSEVFAGFVLDIYAWLTHKNLTYVELRISSKCPLKTRRRRRRRDEEEEK